MFGYLGEMQAETERDVPHTTHLVLPSYVEMSDKADSSAVYTLDLINPAGTNKDISFSYFD